MFAGHIITSNLVVKDNRIIGLSGVLRSGVTLAVQIIHSTPNNSATKPVHKSEKFPKKCLMPDHTYYSN